ncbi:MAG: hypothetical protein LBB56_05260 [Chitinispirillales bacterium]|jgi:hypothetical protein|nr:hypothetical protein [Chitinispirillales bacterium]
MGYRIYLLLLLFIFLSTNVHSQELFTKELQWQEKNELTTSLYKAFEDFINEEPKPYKKQKTGRYNSLWELLTSNKRRENTEQQKKQEAKIFIDSHFIVRDSILELIFYDKDQIIEWSKNSLPFAYVYSEDFCVQECSIYIVMVAGCSGLPCWNIDVFKEKDGLWQLITGTHARRHEMIIIKIDENQGKFLFVTTSNKVIGELPFEWLLNSD